MYQCTHIEDQTNLFPTLWYLRHETRVHTRVRTKKRTNSFDLNNNFFKEIGRSLKYLKK